jgi:glycosyltransferase involved in cell wall biosynthesis
MKVIISTRAAYPYHGYGGMERYFYSLATHLTKQGLEVEILTSLDETNKKSTNYNGVKYAFVPPNFERTRRFSIFYLNYHYFNFMACRYLKNMNFDILHGCGGILNYLLLNKRKPTVFQPFGLEQFKGRKSSRIYNLIASYPFTCYTIKHADAIASLGEPNSQEIMDLFKVQKEKIFNLPNGIDLSLVKEYLANTKITRDYLGIQGADLVLMNVNRLSPNKGVSYLIDALKILNKELNVKLILIGAGSQEQKIKEQIKKLKLQDKVVHFKSISDEEMFQLYNLADISVTPTLYEGGCPPLVVLEAMATGKPIVGSDIPLMREGIKKGETGFLVPPRNPKAIAEAVLKIYDKNLIEKMGRKSKEIVKNYDWSIIAKKAIKQYEELIGR